MVGVGFTLQPDEAFLSICRPLIAEADYFEVAPETMWYGDGPTLKPNGYHRTFAAIKADTGKPFVAHGVGLSLGTSDREDGERRQRWLDAVRRDHATFDFGWYTEHLGATSLDGQAVTLPMPLPMTGQAARIVRGRLRSMQRIVPLVGVENSVSYFMFGDPLEEPAFLKRIVKPRGVYLLLDLHNVYTMATNFDFDPNEYIDRLDLERVIEIHISGGADSDPRWLGGKSLRLDSHDTAVPEPVWGLLQSVLPRCPKLRGVTLERMEGTVESTDVIGLQEELTRLRAMVSPG